MLLRCQKPRQNKQKDESQADIPEQNTVLKIKPATKALVFDAAHATVYTTLKACRQPCDSCVPYTNEKVVEPSTGQTVIDLETSTRIRRAQQHPHDSRSQHV